MYLNMKTQRSRVSDLHEHQYFCHQKNTVIMAVKNEKQMSGRHSSRND